jgi:hypothetical protein
MQLKEMIRKVHHFLKRLTAVIEILISFIVLAGLLLSFIPLIKELPALSQGTGMFAHFLEFAFDLVIGIEFLEMLNNHSPGSALEVFLFAIVRHMVIEGGSALDMLIGVLAVGLIFVIRKYVYVHSFEEEEEPSKERKEPDMSVRRLRHPRRRVRTQPEGSADGPEETEEAILSEEVPEET